MRHKSMYLYFSRLFLFFLLIRRDLSTPVDKDIFI